MSNDIFSKKQKTEFKTLSYQSIGAGALLAPLPAVIVSCGGSGIEKSNFISIAWTGIVNTKPPMLSISVRKSRYSYKLLQENPKFIVHSLYDNQAKMLDLLGTVSGSKINKANEYNLSLAKYQDDYPLYWASCPLIMPCELVQEIHLGTHELLIAEIKDCLVDTALLDENKALHLEDRKLLAYAHGSYYSCEQCNYLFGQSRTKLKIIKKRFKKLRK